MNNLTKEEREKQKIERIGTVVVNLQGCEMKVIEYTDSKHIVIEFQDEFHETHTATWQQFLHGEIHNSHCDIHNKSTKVYGVGNSGNKPKYSSGRVRLKEYLLWTKMLERCFSTNVKQNNPTYINVTCSEEFLSYDFFYDWCHDQTNWKALYDSDITFSLDKDILIKGNKIYSPTTCCLVPHYVNSLFIKRDAARGQYVIGVSKKNNQYVAQWSNNKGNKFRVSASTEKDAFDIYKTEKEKVIKQVAEEEYKKGFITEKCYQAMLNYEVEMTD